MMPKGHYKRKLRRQVVIDGNIVYIPLTRNQRAIVDREDYEAIPLLQENWYAIPNRGKFYAEKLVNRKLLSMSHLILGKPKKGFVVDHISGDSLDNRKSNLRFATRQQNSWNYNSIDKNKTSKYKGVHFRHSRNKWVASIRHNYKLVLIGSCYKNEEEAARAYDEKAKELFGKFAKLNFPI